MKKRIAIGVAIGLVCALIIVVLTGYLFSRRLSEENFTVEKSLPSSVRVCHLSDLHFPNNGVDLAELEDAVSSAKPDLVLLTGDIFDGKTTEDNLKALGDFLLKIRAAAPTYAVIGNHEIGSPLLQSYSAVCRENGVELLDNELIFAEIKGVSVLLAGLKDGAAFSEANLPGFEQLVAEKKPRLSLLLAHRPELLKNYAAGRFDAVFAGHAHGGQMRIFGVGLYAPNQGFFPSYSSGKYREQETDMFVSRGLGDSISDFRCFNSYNMIIVDFM